MKSFFVIRISLLLLVFTSYAHLPCHSHGGSGVFSGSGYGQADPRRSQCSASEAYCTPPRTGSPFPFSTLQRQLTTFLSSYDPSTLAYACTFLTSTASLIGLVLLPLPPLLISMLFAFSSGALLTDVFLHLLPHAYQSASASLVAGAALLGVLTFSTLARLLARLLPHEHLHPDGAPAKAPGGGPAAPVYLNLVADALHNFNDGMAIAGAFLVSVPAGLSTTLAVWLHELPQEIGDFAYLVHGGLSRPVALAANFLCALVALAGCALVVAVGEVVAGLEATVAPFAAGGLLYMAVAGVLREVERMDKKRNTCEWLGALMRDAVAAAFGAVVVASIEQGFEH